MLGKAGQEKQWDVAFSGKVSHAKNLFCSKYFFLLSSEVAQRLLQMLFGSAKTFTCCLEVTGSAWKRAKRIHREHQEGEGEWREWGKKLKSIWVKCEPNFKLQLCTILCIMKETCLNSTTGVTEALMKDDGQQSSAPHTAGFHIPLQNYWESLKLPRKREITKKVWKYRVLHGSPHPTTTVVKALGLPGWNGRAGASPPTFKGSKLIQTWWDAGGSAVRDTIYTENPTCATW